MLDHKGLLNKIEEEIAAAKQAKSNSTLKEYIARTQLLCELILESDENESVTQSKMPGSLDLQMDERMIQSQPVTTSQEPVQSKLDTESDNLLDF